MIATAELVVPKSIPITAPWTLPSEAVDSYRANFDAKGALVKAADRAVMGVARGSYSEGQLKVAKSGDDRH